MSSASVHFNSCGSDFKKEFHFKMHSFSDRTIKFEIKAQSSFDYIYEF